MVILDLIHKEKSNILYEIIKFPDGESHIKLFGEINHKEEFIVKCRITCADDLFILMQVGDILNRHEVRWNLHIYYLMSMRMDRVISFNESYSLKIVANVISTLKPYSISVAHPHSDVTLKLLNCNSFLNKHPNWGILRGSEIQLCFPDKGARDRYSDLYETKWSLPILLGKKVRNQDTGKIESIIIENPEDYQRGHTIMVVDDLCDAGGTFLGIAEAIKKIDAKAKLEINVIHMVNRKGIENLSKTYDKVYFTNSYKDWTDLPDNCIMFDVITNKNNLL